MSCPPPRPAPPLSETFFRKLHEMAGRLNMDTIALLMAMNVESMGVNPAACNPGSGAAGLIQLMKLPAVGWTGSRDAFLALSPEDQLPYAERFLAPYARYGLKTAGRIHQAIFMPGTLGSAVQPGDVICSADGTRWPNKAGVPQEPLYYSQNAATFDPGKKGYITVGDLQAADERAAQTARFTQVLAWAKASLPEIADRIPARIVAQPAPAPSRPTTNPSTGASIMPLLLLVGVGAGAYMLTRNSGRRIRFA